jgi:queuine/archaeosine tRNA-ribosyltransferase
LISAYDLAAAEDIDRTDIQQRLVELQKRAAALFLDSGNYEAYRKGARNEPQAGAKEQWTESRYHAVMSGSVYDAAFSFDSAYPSVNVREHVFDSVSQYKRDSAKTQGRPVVPIVHAPLSSAKRRTYSVLPELTRSLVNEIDPHMIAVAERELGDGIIQRAKTIQAIREALGSSSQYRMLHILGTGNLLSATVYAAAGADTFDGLEWCRTVADHDSGHLFHQQHFDFFADQAKVSEFQEVREYVTDRKRDYYLRLLVHNLDYCQKWVEELRFRVAQHSIGPMIDGFLPGAAQHLKSAIPGLL